MPVAKSYQKFSIVGEPFVTNGRKYVTLSNGKTVRWYTDAEYSKLYNEPVEIEKISRTLREVLGFSKGFVTIFKGDTYAYLDWFRACAQTRYNKIWGWFVPSEDEVPADLPTALTAVTLSWDAIATSDSTLKAEKEIAAVVDALINEPSLSEWVGAIGDRIEVSVVVKQAMQTNSYYGTSTFHIFEDENGNILTWTTTAKNLPVGNSYVLRGTVKNLDTYKNCKQTVLTRCTIVAEGE